MTIGAREFIDKLLVEKYSNTQVENHNSDALESRVKADDMMYAMNASASNFKTMIALNKRLTSVCYGVVSKSAKYMTSEDLINA